MPKVIIPNHKIQEALHREGFSVIAGIDEVGRGSLAGPVTAAALILPTDVRLKGIRDSKYLTRVQREKAVLKIRPAAAAIGLGWSSHREVDQHGLTWAVRQAGLRALENLNRLYDFVILDGSHNYLSDHFPSRAIIRADQSCLAVACASIIAKVARDNYMTKLHRLYPEYMFHRNKGYGTLMHRHALNRKVSPVHRRRYLPVKFAAEAVDVY